MKRALLFLNLLFIFAGLLMSSCDDNLTTIGTTIQPPGDQIIVYTDTFLLKASTVLLDSIYAKTTDCLLGEMHDPVYGIIKADILCQFYCEEGFKFRHTPYNNKIDSVEILIGYFMNSNNAIIAYGDTLTPMQVTVYPINKPITRNFYTNDQPEQYCDMQNPLGCVTYTLFDFKISDSIRELTSYFPEIRVKLPVEIGQKFYEETINNPSTFSNQNNFNAFFPGIYLTNTYGSGCLFPTSGESVGMRIFYSIPNETDGAADSVISQVFRATKDVIQINRFKNSNIDQLLNENPTHTYIKSPAGVCTKLVMPTAEIAKKIDIENRIINGFTLNLKYLPEDEWAFRCAPPECLLLLPEDSVTTFFEKSSVENDITSYVSFMPTNGYLSYSSKYATSNGYSPYTRTYAFGNISGILKSHIENAPDKDLTLMLIPVHRKTYTNDNQTYYTTGISHSFQLAGVKIRTEEEYMKVVVLSSKYEGK